MSLPIKQGDLEPMQIIELKPFEIMWIAGIMMGMSTRSGIAPDDARALRRASTMLITLADLIGTTNRVANKMAPDEDKL